MQKCGGVASALGDSDPAPWEGGREKMYYCNVNLAPLSRPGSGGWGGGGARDHPPLRNPNVLSPHLGLGDTDLCSPSL